MELNLTENLEAQFFGARQVIGKVVYNTESAQHIFVTRNNLLKLRSINVASLLADNEAITGLKGRLFIDIKYKSIYLHLLERLYKVSFNVSGLKTLEPTFTIMRDVVQLSLDLNQYDILHLNILEPLSSHDIASLNDSNPLYPFTVEGIRIFKNNIKIDLTNIQDVINTKLYDIRWDA